MGGTADSQPPFDFLNQGSITDLSWEKVLEYQAKRRSCGAGSLKTIKRCRTISIQRRAAHASPASGNLQIQRKARILKKLVPNCDSMALDTLFTETADYILALQMRVQVMQVLVNVLSASE